MVTISAFHHASLLIDDLDRSKGFYEGLLGLRSSNDRPQMPYDGVWYQIGAQQLHLLVLPSPDAGLERPPHGGHDHHVALTVSDFEALKQALDKAGVPYSLSKSGRKALFCRDPDGNALELIG
ncbi:MAG: VOC family protein [Pseudomonadota bacterium]